MRKNSVLTGKNIKLCIIYLGEIILISWSDFLCLLGANRNFIFIRQTNKLLIVYRPKSAVKKGPWPAPEKRSERGDDNQGFSDGSGVGHRPAPAGGTL